MDRSAPSPTPALVGRDRERSRLDALLAAAAGGTAGTLLVHGEAGIGKTALAREAAARTQGTALYGAALPLNSMMVPLLTITSVVRARPQGVPRLDLQSARDLAEAPSLFDAWLDAVTQSGPATLVVDDLQWADQSSLDLLQYVITGPVSRPLAIVGTVRSTEVSDEHPLARWLADVRRQPRVEEIALAALDKEATLDQLTNLLGTAPHTSLVDDVYARSGGNPYFTRLLATGVPSDARTLPATMPSSLRNALLRSWSTMADSSRRATQVLAIGGHPATSDELDNVAPDHAWDVVLREAAAAGVVDELPGGAYWFHHPLIAEILEKEMPLRMRRERHRAFALWWEGRPPSEELATEAARAALVADHWFHAEDGQQARAWAVRAADAAEQAGRWSEAVRLLTRELARNPAPEHGPDRVGILQRARADAEAAGDIEGELDILDDLLSRFDPDEEPLVVADLLVRRATVRQLTGRPFDEDGAMQRAEELARSRPPSATLVRTMAWSAMYGHWEPEERVALSVAALAIARDIGESVGLALTARTVVAYIVDDAATAIACAAEAVPMSIREGDWQTAAKGTHYRRKTIDSPWSPWYAEQIARDREHLLRSGAPAHEILLFNVLEADARLYIGDWEDCARILRSCMAARQRPMWDAGGRLTLAHLAVLQGRAAEAAAHVARAEELVVNPKDFTILDIDAVRALIALSTGDLEGAFAQAVEGLRYDDAPPCMVEYLLPLAARALADQVEQRRAAGGEVADLQRRAAELVAAHPHVIVDVGEIAPWYAAEAEAFQVLYRAELARATASPDARLLWRVTTIRARRACLRWDEAYAGWRWAEALLRSGERGSEVATVLRDAHALATRLGAVPVIDAVEHLAASAHVSLAEVEDEPEGGKQAESALPGLTPRENEIVSHLVAGRTYAEIAATLVISEKTVSSHVSNILRKTGAKNRIELAVMAQHRAAVDVSHQRPAPAATPAQPQHRSGDRT